MKYNYLMMAAVLMSAAFPSASHAQDTIYRMTMTEKGFSPADLTVPAGQKIHLIVDNKGTAEAEFESYPLNQEHKIQPGQSEEMFLDAMKPGSYEVFDDNNPDVKGRITAQ